MIRPSEKRIDDQVEEGNRIGNEEDFSGTQKPLSADKGFTLYEGLATSSPLYVPHDLHTRWERFNSPHSGHFTMPGTASFTCVRRCLFRALEVRLFGTAISCHLLKINVQKTLAILFKKLR